VALFLYTCLCYLALPLGVVVHLLFVWRRPEFRQGFWQRYGFLPTSQHRPVLVHAASVGELNAIAPLIKRLVTELKLPVLVTTTSVTGQARCRKLFAANDRISWGYLPFDLGFANHVLMRRVNPRAVLLVETELWPNIIGVCARKGLPVMLVNGRLSARSAHGYQRVQSLVGPMLKKLTHLWVQDQDAANRFIALGAKTDAVTVVGSLKYDMEIPPEQQAVAEAMRQLGLAPSNSCGLNWVCGSTRKGEEASLLQAWSQLPSNINGTLVIVPRHPQRFEAVADLCQESGLPWLQYSRWEQEKTLEPAFQDALEQGKKRVLLVDSMGLLVDFYRIADVVFVGGSLAHTGGHNPLEASVLGKPVIMGPHCFNFAQVCDQLEQVHALKITTTSTLLDDISILLSDAELRQSMGLAGQALINQEQGSLNRHIDAIAGVLEQAIS